MTKGTKIAVASLRLSLNFCTAIPIMRASPRYIIELEATLLPLTGSTNVFTVMSVNAVIMYMSENHRKIRKRINALFGICAFTTSAMDFPSCLMEAISALISWTPPTNTPPRMIQSMAGPQPNHMPAKIGPMIGPAAAIAERCWPKR